MLSSSLYYFLTKNHPISGWFFGLKAENDNVVNFNANDEMQNRDRRCIFTL